MKKIAAFGGRAVPFAFRSTVLGASVACLLALPPAIAGASAAAPAFSDLMREGTTYVAQGNLELALEAFGRARMAAPDADTRAEVDGEMGSALVTAGRYTQAQPLLKRAYEVGGRGRAARAIDLGNLALAIHHPAEAKAFFQEARKISVAANDTVVSATAGLGEARAWPEGRRIALLEEVGEFINIEYPRPQLSILRLQVNLGHQARTQGERGRALARASLARAIIGSASLGNLRLQSEAMTELALLEEKDGRPAEALQQSRAALDIVYRQPPATVTDLKITLEFLQGRLLQASHNSSAALVSFQQAAEAIESVRAEMPIEDLQDDQGHSTYETTIDPVTRKLVSLLVDQAMLSEAPKGESFLKRAVDAEERMHQAEMQDFLGDRCTVESANGDTADRLEPGVAVIYPLVLEDRVELLMRTSSGITHRRVKVSGATIGTVVKRFAATLRAGEFEFEADSQNLYSWLIAPLEEEITREKIQVLVFSPDASLHVVPFAALNDGKQYAIEKYAIADVAGLTMTNLGSGRKGTVESLVAGMAEPGPVLGKLDQRMVGGILGAAEAPTRGLPPAAAEPAAAPAPGAGEKVAEPETAHGARLSVLKERALAAHQRSVGDQSRAVGDQDRSVGDQDRAVGDQERKVGDLARLKKELSLPGVREEVSSLHAILPGRSMMDAAFTAQGFSDSAGSGDYGIVHIASHGFFGKDADSSFVLAYDDLLTMNQLQSLLTTDKVKQNPIDLLTLSACETAEGNARAPLGIAGAGIKARARSVVGTLWPVDDDAAKIFMQRFYKGVVDGKVGKAESMRQAQIALLQNPETAHPIFWAPFTLIGNWQ